MAMDAEKLRNWKFEDVVQTFTQRDTMLYALGVGCGSDPLDESELRYVYEDNLVALPTMVTVLGYQGFWLKDSGTGVDWRKVVHGEQAITIHAPVPTAGTFIGRSRITAWAPSGSLVIRSASTFSSLRSTVTSIDVGSTPGMSNCRVNTSPCR